MYVIHRVYSSKWLQTRLHNDRRWRRLFCSRQSDRSCVNAGLRAVERTTPLPHSFRWHLPLCSDQFRLKMSVCNWPTFITIWSYTCVDFTGFYILFSHCATNITFCYVKLGYHCKLDAELSNLGLFWTTFYLNMLHGFVNYFLFCLRQIISDTGDVPGTSIYQRTNAHIISHKTLLNTPTCFDLVRSSSGSFVPCYSYITVFTI